MGTLKKISLVVLVIFYLFAGINHFRSPESYIRIIPSYFPAKPLLNMIAGICEMAFALLLIPKQTRRFAAWGIILMLIAFIPVHLQMVIDAPLKLGTLTVSPLVAWIRLVILQSLLIAWAACYIRND